MKQRNLIWMFVLTIVTFGIYSILWTYWTKEEMNRLGNKVPRFIWLMAPFLIMLFIALSQFIVRFVMNGATGNEDVVVRSANIMAILLGIVVVLVILPIYIIWYYRYCEAADKVTNGELPTTLNFILLLGMGLFSLSGLWPLIVQNSFNKVASKDSFASLNPNA